MKCYIKSEKYDIYFNKFLYFSDSITKKTLMTVETSICHWTYRDEAKIFDSIAEARATIKLYKLKNIKIEKIYSFKKRRCKNEDRN